MKRLFFPSILAATAAMMLHSCQSTDVYNPDQKKEDFVEQYKQNFRNNISSDIAPNQSWGFDATSALTAVSTHRANEKGDNYELADTYMKKWRSAYHIEMIDSLPILEGGKTLKPSLSTNYEFKHRGSFRFDIIYSNTSDNVEIGFYYYDPKTEDFSTVYKSRMRKLVSNFKDDQLSKQYYQYSFYSEPTDEQWETTKPVFGPDLVRDPRIQRYHSRMFTLTDIPVGSYVGFYLVGENRKDTIFSNRDLNKDQKHNYFACVDSKDPGANLSNTYVVGMEDLYDSALAPIDYGCNDIMIAVHKSIEGSQAELWPLLVTPKKPEPKISRIIAEDLTLSQGTDFDFNDIVLDVELTATGANCILQAAGATLPIRINGQDANEVHRLFGVSTTTMVNTYWPDGKSSGATKDPVRFSITGSFSSAKDVKIEVNQGTAASPQWIELFANRGEPACKIAVTTDFVWPYERQSIKERYPKFPDWVKDPTVVWYP
jgi:hypothetical protein